jgi:hypothetical protein
VRAHLLEAEAGRRRVPVDALHATLTRTWAVKVVLRPDDDDDDDAPVYSLFD